MSPRIVIASLLFASSTACAVPSYAQSQEKSSAATAAPQAKSQSTPSHRATQAPSGPIVRPFSVESSATDPTGGKAQLTPPAASLK